MRNKAQVVTASGDPDPRPLARGWRLTTFPDGKTQLAVSVPAEERPALFEALARALSGKLGVLYVRLTDRKLGQLPKPERRVAMHLDPARALGALRARPTLIHEDGRHQLWLRGDLGEQVVLDELGMIYCYPDDPAFRDALAGLPETTAPMLCDEEHFPYVKVNFLAEADAEETSLWDELHMIKWGA